MPPAADGELPATVVQARRHARASALIYVSDTEPGIRRKRRGAHFEYLGSNGRPVKAPRTLDRIRRLAIPPDDRRLARIIRRCQQLPGQQLFQYVDDDGQRQPVDSGMVNDYLREAMSGNGGRRRSSGWCRAGRCRRPGWRRSRLHCCANESRTNMRAPQRVRACRQKNEPLHKG